MHIICPHCHSPVEPAAAAVPAEVVCGACGSTFLMETGSTTAWQPPDGQRMLGRFELLDVVGSGAFGTVYKARDPELDRVVAIKVPRAGSLATGADLDRFLREARSVAQLRHPSIVSVHEVGQQAGLPYLVSDFVPGATLADLLTAGRPAPRRAAALVAAVADALQYAHDRGVVHRDVKPSNIQLDDDGTPHVMDFGLARREAGEVTMTIDGQVLGTPAYMSPEQARGEAHTVDGRGDVYSLGVILYELLTGALPFQGNARVLLQQVRHDEPRPPRRLQPQVPRDLETVCLKAMAKEPARRYATARELADDLRRFLAGEPIRARRVGRAARLGRWCRRNPVMAALLAVIAVLVAIVLGLLWKGEPLRQRDTIKPAAARGQPNPVEENAVTLQDLADRARRETRSGAPGESQADPAQGMSRDYSASSRPDFLDDAPEVVVGHYVSLPEKGPSVLLSRRSDLYPWQRLDPEDLVLTGRLLVSLPGYRSEVLLDSGVQLTLWGNVPEFGGVPPLLLESAAMLNAPKQGTDLDVSLEWGRIRIANRKDAGPARVRLRFKHETWDLTLADSDSEAAAELWAVLPTAADAARRLPPRPVLGLFSQGSVTLDRIGGQPEHLDLAGNARVAWTSGRPGPLFRQSMPGPPGWWGKPSTQGPGLERVLDAMRTLEEWSDRLDNYVRQPKNNAYYLVGTILKGVDTSDDLSFREQGMYFLAALDRAPFVVRHLDDVRHVRVRRAASHAVRAWLSRGLGRAVELPRLLEVKGDYSPDTPALILSLLYPYSEEELFNSATYQRLIRYLDHTNLVVRELAAWHLEELAPEEARQVAYDPAADPEARRQALAHWQRLLPPGALPRKGAK